ncbi:two-component sensor histidine kinase [Agromyces luteolus]|uniref:histidine kinase n=1 Tax=Agromyces luteolus TaxID=88373 RepID=A0A7C9LFF5_9MICO|nr:HAMP domain-containing sensor histidine kinase [Agromyces luteolus]MUN05734.1 sensor histidine kinase [Agromyces luteolus]GLK26280.1 two-component sensor histidine kinase [Agromyces luteolus]
MSGTDLLLVIAVSAAIAAAVGFVAWLLLRRFAWAPIVVHLVTVVVAAVASVVGGVLVATQAMYLSDHDAQIALAIAVTSGVVAILTASILGAEIARAARVLRSAAEDLGRGIPVESRPLPIGEFRAVLDELAASDARIRAAREEVERQEQARRELVTRVAHDLRVPLAGIRAQAEALQDGLAPDPDRYLARIASQVDRLDALVADLFAVSQIDAGTLHLRTERLSLADVASDAVAELRGLADGAGVRLDLDVASDASPTVDGDALQLGRAVANLLANALQHTPAGGRIAVTVDGEGDEVRLAVADSGPGFAPEELAHAFEAGWRGSSARSPHRLDVTGGAGLGLAIVRGIARAHGGDASATNAPAGGAVLALTLPRSA